MKSKQEPTSRFILSSFIIVAVLGLSSAHAASDTWNQAAAGTFSWNDNANWLSGTQFPNGIGDSATITTTLPTGTTTINLNQGTTLGTLSMGRAGQTLTIAPNGGRLIFDVASGSAALNVLAGSNTISAGILLNDALTITNDVGLTISSVGISGYGNLTKSGAGNLSLGGTGSYLGNTFVTQGKLTLTSAAALASEASLAISSGAEVTSGLGNTLSGLTGSGNYSITDATFGKTLTINTDASSLFSGEINYANTSSGTNSLNKLGTGAFTLSGTGGKMVTGSGTTALAVNGGSFQLDNTSDNVADRVQNTVRVSLGGGDFRLIGNASVTTTETVSNLTATSGRVTVAPGSGQSALLTFGTFALGGSSSSVVFRGIGLGGTGADTSQIKFTTAPTLTGGAGSGAQTSIIAGAIGATSATGGGSGFVTYDGTLGVRLLDESTEYATYATSANANDNVKFTATGAFNAAAGGGTGTSTNINSVLFKNTSGSSMTVTLGDSTNLNPVSGMFLFSGDASNPITLARTDATSSIAMGATTRANFFVTESTVATLDPVVSFSGAGALVKDGGGTLIVSYNISTGTNALGQIIVNGGTLKAGGSNITGTPSNSAQTSLTVRSGGTFDMNGFAQALPSNSGFDINAGGVLTNTGANANFTTGTGSTVISTIEGLITDGTPGDEAATGLISLAFNPTGTATRTYNFTRGGHTFNNVSISGGTGSGNAAATFTSRDSSEGNTVYGTVSLGGFSNTTINANVVSNGSTVSKTFGNADINLRGSGLALKIKSSGETAAITNQTLAWTNNVTVSGNSTILIDNNDGVSTGVTQQFGALTLTGANRTLITTANNGYTLEFTGATDLSHSAAANRTLDVTAGTLALNSISESGSGAKTLIKSGGGTLVINGAATYTGATNVNAGKLVVNDSIGASAVSVSNAGTILATDTAASFGSTLAINAGAILAVGDAANTATATATVAGATTFGNTSIFSWDINAVGMAYDKVITTDVLGEVTPGDAVFRIVASDALVAANFWNTNQTWNDIFSKADTTAISTWATVFGSTVSLVNSSFNPITTAAGSFTLTGSTLSWSAVPEPTSALAGLLLGACLLRRRRSD